jgi:hypothetical protein
MRRGWLAMMVMVRCAKRNDFNLADAMGSCERAMAMLVAKRVSVVKYEPVGVNVLDCMKAGIQARSVRNVSDISE